MFDGPASPMPLFGVGGLLSLSLTALSFSLTPCFRLLLTFTLSRVFASFRDFLLRVVSKPKGLAAPGATTAGDVQTARWIIVIPSVPSHVTGNVKRSITSWEIALESYDTVNYYETEIFELDSRCCPVCVLR